MSLLSPPGAPLRNCFPLVGRGALPVLPSVVAIVDGDVSDSVAVDEGARMLRVEDRMSEVRGMRMLGKLYEAAK